MLASIEPHLVGVDLRTFHCDKCAHVETALVKFTQAALVDALSSPRTGEATFFELICALSIGSLPFKRAIRGSPQQQLLRPRRR